MITLIENSQVTTLELKDFHNSWLPAHGNAALRVGNRQIDASDVKDGDRVNVVVKASGN
jgi:hypothetical protein